MIDKKEDLTYKKIFIFWVPLAATWLMMSTEGPSLAAIIARLADPKFNLAAYGVAYSFGILIEAPIIMIMSTSTALVRDRDSYLKLRNFTFILNGICTLIMIIFVLPPVFHLVAQRLKGLPQNIAYMTHQACLAFLVWPASIGYRRFYQGLLIRNHLTRRVAYSTIIRLITLIAAALSCYFFRNLNGALVGTLALSFSVVAVLSMITFTPLSSLWFRKISGLTWELTNFARFPAQLFSIMPGLTVLISFQRAILIKNKKTAAITIATTVEVLTILLALLATIAWFNIMGVIAAALAIITGRLIANTYLIFPCKKVI